MAYGKLFGTRLCNLLGPAKFVVGALAEMLSSQPRKNANGPEVCARGLRRDVQIRNCFSSLGHSEELPKEEKQFLQAPSILRTHLRFMEQPSRSSVSTSRLSSSSSDEGHAYAVRGQPDIILMGLAAAMDAARKHTMRRRSGTAARSPGSVLTATCVARKLRAAYTQTLFSWRARQTRTAVRSLLLQEPSPSDVFA
jgi:hypothetical protein